MNTNRIYGSSDDLVIFEGAVSGEHGCFGSGEDFGILVAVSDGTLLDVRYGKPGCGAVWGITVLRRGDRFSHFDSCCDENATPYSDVVYLTDGPPLKAWAGRGQPVR